MKNVWILVFLVFAACSSIPEQEPPIIVTGEDVGILAHDVDVKKESDAWFPVEDDMGLSDVAEGDDVTVGDDRREEIHALADKDHRPQGYNSARDLMYERGGVDDFDGKIEGIYTGRTVNADGTRTPGGSCALMDGEPSPCEFNTEHVYPRQYLQQHLTEGTGDYYSAESDIHQLFPTYERANAFRDRYWFGETECELTDTCRFDEESQLGSKLSNGPCSLGTCVMDVRAERRGDIARAMFYMAVMYNLAIDDETEEVLRAWNTDDPPDEREQVRNGRIEMVQGNRNPFVDDASLADDVLDF